MLVRSSQTLFSALLSGCCRRHFSVRPMSRSGSDLNGHEGLPTPYPECVLEGKHFSGELLKQAQSLSNAKRMCAEVDPFPVGSIQEAYDIQAAISQNAIIFQRGMMSRVSHHSGWRVGASNPKSQAAMGLKSPYRGPLFSGYEKKHNSKLRWEESGSGLIDIGAGVAFRLATNILPRPSKPYTEEEVRCNIACLIPVIHICASRIPAGLPPTPETAPMLIADWGMLGSLILGRDAKPMCDVFQETMDEAEVTISANGKTANGRGGDVHGGSAIACATWLVNSLSADGIPLLEGQLLSTGSVAVLTPDQVGFGDSCSVEASFEWGKGRMGSSSPSRVRVVMVDDV